MRPSRAWTWAIPLAALMAAGSCDFWDDDHDDDGRLEVEDADLEIAADLMPGHAEDPVRARVSLLLYNDSHHDVNVEIDRATIRLVADGRLLYSFEMVPEGWSGDLNPWQSRHGAWVKEDTLVDPETPCGEHVYAQILLIVRSASWSHDDEVLDTLTFDTSKTVFGCAY